MPTQVWAGIAAALMLSATTAVTLIALPAAAASEEPEPIFKQLKDVYGIEVISVPRQLASVQPGESISGILVTGPSRDATIRECDFDVNPDSSATLHCWGRRNVSPIVVHLSL